MLRNRCRRRLLLLLITDSIYGIVVEDVDLKRLSVFFKRDTKLILPLRRKIYLHSEAAPCARPCRKVTVTEATGLANVPAW